MIPIQLQNSEFRFIKVQENKAPFEKDWTNKNNYTFDDPKFTNFLNSEKKYGIATGFGNLVVIDFDKEEIQKEILPLLPETFTVKTAGRGLYHLYYIVDRPESFKVLDVNKDTLADIQGKGKQAIGPNSLLNNKKYIVVKDKEIKKIDMALIESLFSKWTKLEEVVRNRETKELDDECTEIKRRVTVSDLLNEYGIDTGKNPTSCPFHSSKGGRCFSYNDIVWHCFHCEQKGNIFHLYMLRNNVNFQEAKNKLAERAGIKIKKKFNGKVEVRDYTKNVERFRKIQPFFYDKSGLFWFWNFEENMYELWDDVDVMIAFDEGIGLEGETVNTKLKTQYMETFKRVGRKAYNNITESPKNWIQFKDKAYDLKENKIYDITPNYFFTNPIQSEIGETDETPTMDKLFNEWVGLKYTKTLYEIIAYCCYSDYPIQLLFCLHGSGRNGKSCFQRLLNNFIGHKNICSTELDTLLNSRFETFKLYRKLVCSLGETNFGVLAKTSLIKKLVGGDVIGFEKKNKDPFDDFNYAKIIISSNSLPSTNDTSDGFYRRWLIIKFPNEFPEGKDILGTIPEIEYRNLARKIINILPELIDRGKFTNQGSIKERRDNYISVSNPLPLFINLCCETYESAYTSYNELYTAYVNYLKLHKKRRVKSREFRTALEDEGYWVEKTTKKIEKDDGTYEYMNGNWIEGLKLRSDWKELICENCENYAGFSTSYYTHERPNMKSTHNFHKSHKPTVLEEELVE